MRFDLTPYRRSTIGFDRLFDLMEANARGASENYRTWTRSPLELRYRGATAPALARGLSSQWTGTCPLRASRIHAPSSASYRPASSRRWARQ